MRRGGTFHIFTFPFRIISGPGDRKPGGAFAFQIKRLRRGVTFPWKPGMVSRFFTFLCNRLGTFRIFTCTNEMAGWQWLCRGVTFHTFKI